MHNVALGRIRLVDRLLVALAVGVAAGLCEAAMLWGRRATGSPTFLDPRTVWTAPVADACLLSAVAFVVHIAGRRWRFTSSQRAGSVALVFVGLTSVLLNVASLSSLAVVLLAGGIAWQAGTRMSGASTAFIRRFVVVLLVPAVLIGFFHEGSRWFRQSNRRDTPPANLSKTNLLLVVLDTVRASNLSLYGYERSTTPGLERLAKRSVVFDRVFATSPWTLPSHASMFTGRSAHEMTADWLVPLDRAHPVLAEYLRNQGYATAGFVANTVYGSAEFGLGRGFSHYEDFDLSFASVLAGSALVRRLIDSKRIRSLIGYHELVGRKPADAVNRSFLGWLDVGDGRPFFAFLNYYDAHDPYLPPDPFATRFSDRRPRGDLRPAGELSQDDRQELTDAYDGALAYVDDRLDALLRELENRGLLSKTLVVITSDHGEEFGEHGLVGHGNSLYLESLHVPLLISLPGVVPAGVRVSSVVSLRDLPATVVEFLAVEDGAPFPGVSLSRHWRGDPPIGGGEARADVRQSFGQPAWYPVMRGALSSLVTDEFQYIRNWGDDHEELFPLQRAQGLTRDLSGRPEAREILGAFRSRLRQGIDPLTGPRRP